MTAIRNHGGTGQPNYPLHRVQPEQMARCPFDMTCSDPQGECMGACDLTSNVAPLAVDIDLPDDSRMTLAIDAYRTHRATGRRKAIACAWRALMRSPIQPANK